MSHLLNDHPDWPNAMTTPRTDAAIIRDKMILSEVGPLEIVDAGTSRQLERELAAAQERVEDLEVRCANAEARAGAFRSALLELRIRLHSAGRRPEECHEMSLIDAAIAEGKK